MSSNRVWTFYCETQARSQIGYKKNYIKFTTLKTLPENLNLKSKGKLYETLYDN